MEGISPALLHEGQRFVFPYLVKTFHGCVVTGYILALWHQVKIVFKPKSGKNSYRGPRYFRPINLKSFLLKNMERLVDMFLTLRLPNLFLNFSTSYMKNVNNT
jgi:hypothetical protein